MSSPALELSEISLHYGFVRALQGVSLSVAAGETVALLGDNGAGKSTLLKVMSGAHKPSAGSIAVHGAPIEFGSPGDAAAAGIEMVYQDLALVDALDASTNLGLGQEPLRRGPLGWLGFVDKRRMREQAVDEITRLGVKLPSLSRPVEMLSGGQRQGIALARAAVRVGAGGQGILLLDEPTAALGYEQKLMVRRLIGNLNEHGISIVLVTHDLPLAFESAHRMVVLNRGRKVADIATAETDNDAIVGWITGSRAPQSPLS